MAIFLACIPAMILASTDNLIIFGINFIAEFLCLISLAYYSGKHDAKVNHEIRIMDIKREAYREIIDLAQMHTPKRDMAKVLKLIKRKDPDLD